MSKLFILQGLPGSGKSTFARQLKKTRHKSAETLMVVTIMKIVSSDDIRLTCLPNGFYHESKISDEGYQSLVSDFVWETVKNNVKQGLIDKYDVIVDACSIKREYWSDYITIARETNSQVVGVEINTSLDSCIYRDKKRDVIVGEHVIRNMEREREYLHKYEEDFDQMITINQPIGSDMI